VEVKQVRALDSVAWFGLETKAKPARAGNRSVDGSVAGTPLRGLLVAFPRGRGARQPVRYGNEPAVRAGVFGFIEARRAGRSGLDFAASARERAGSLETRKLREDGIALLNEDGGPTPLGRNEQTDRARAAHTLDERHVGSQESSRSVHGTSYFPNPETFGD